MSAQREVVPRRRIMVHRRGWLLSCINCRFLAQKHENIAFCLKNTIARKLIQSYKIFTTLSRLFTCFLQLVRLKTFILSASLSMSFVFVFRELAHTKVQWSFYTCEIRIKGFCQRSIKIEEFNCTGVWNHYMTNLLDSCNILRNYDIIIMNVIKVFVIKIRENRWKVFCQPHIIYTFYRTKNSIIIYF